MLYKITEWQSSTGRWYAANVDDLAGAGSAWWLVPRILQLAPADYILLLKDKFNAGNFSFIDYGEKDERNSLLLFSFDKYEDCHRYVLYINKIARQQKIMI